MVALSIRESLAGKHVLLTGASGFLGKVWIQMILDRLPEIGKLYVLMRPKGRLSARQRFEKMLGSSYIFKTLHEKHGADLSAFVSARVVVLRGTLDKDDLDLEDDIAEGLRERLDLFINCAGNIDFNPDPRDAIATNIKGTLRCVAFAKSCRKARLLQVSTCYVAGNQDGRIDEGIGEDRCPSGKPFNAAEEYAALQEHVERMERALADPETGIANRRERKKELRKRLTEFGTERARYWGWPNTYTYTKNLGERLMIRDAGDLPYTIFRPAIVESSLSYPFPGWNEGFNGSGPLAYLLGKWFRHFPAREGNPFDVVPVDLVCNAMTIASAALLKGVHAPIYHCGTSDRNTLEIDRACELVGLHYRKRLRQDGEGFFERNIVRNLEAVPTPYEHFWSVTNIRRYVGGAEDAARSLADKLPKGLSEKLTELADRGKLIKKKLKPIEGMLELFRPFVHDNHITFLGDNFKAIEVAEEEFRFEPERICWRKYWLEVHLPGLWRWCYPKIEGREVEQYHPATPFELRSSASELVTSGVEQLAG